MPGGIPICVYEPEIGMFRVILVKGKALSNGGYGVTWTRQCSFSSSSSSSSSSPTVDKDNDVPTMIDSSPQVKKSVSSTSEYLFIEEVLFLHEKGLLQALRNAVDPSSPNTNKDEKKENNSKNDDESHNVLDTRDLYDIMIHELHVPMSVYLTYSHLRSQTFIVVRHTARRLSLIHKIQNITDNTAKKNGNKTSDSAIENGQEKETSPPRKKRSTDGDKKEEEVISTDNKRETKTNDDGEISTTPWKRQRKRPAMDLLKLELRQDAFHARMPRVLTTINDSPANNCEIPSDTNDGDNIAFDVYTPNSKFRKTNPGIPSFCVAITSFAEPSPPFPLLQTLIRECEGVPLRLATVADGGTVIMFGLTDYGVPSISNLKS